MQYNILRFLEAIKLKCHNQLYHHLRFKKLFQLYVRVTLFTPNLTREILFPKLIDILRDRNVVNIIKRCDNVEGRV